MKCLWAQDNNGTSQKAYSNVAEKFVIIFIIWSKFMRYLIHEIKDGNWNMDIKNQKSEQKFENAKT